VTGQVHPDGDGGKGRMTEDNLRRLTEYVPFRAPLFLPLAYFKNGSLNWNNIDTHLVYEELHSHTHNENISEHSQRQWLHASQI
jgi:hypothetical protein